MKLLVNGDPMQTETSLTVAAVVERLHPAHPRAGLAVAVNGEVVPRSAWDDRELEDGDRVEVLTAIGGG